MSVIVADCKNAFKAIHRKAPIKLFSTDRDVNRHPYKEEDRPID